MKTTQETQQSPGEEASAETAMGKGFPQTRPRRRSRRGWVLAAVAGCVLAAVVLFIAGSFWPRGQSRSGSEIVIEELDSGGAPPIVVTEDEHPLDPALRIAQSGLEKMQGEIDDYTATVYKRERIGGELTEEEVMFCKVRNRRREDGRLVQPLSVYLRSEQPAARAGREVIWVEGENDGRLIAHDTGIGGLIRWRLDPKSQIAMWGNRYPISELGLQNLVEKMIQLGEQEKKNDDVEVEYSKRMLDDRKCLLIEVRHPEKKPAHKFYIARIFVDEERQIPLRYAAYSWPEAEGGEPVLEEEYTYLGVTLNPGLTDADFDPDNPDYEFP